MSTESSGGIGCFGLLAIVFIVMKLASIGAVASWSWLWVLSPIWLPFTIFMVVVVVLYLIRQS